MVISSENRKRSQSKIQLLEVATAARFKATVEAQYDSATFAALLDKHALALRRSYASAVANGWQLDEISSSFCLDEARVHVAAEWNEDIYTIAWNEMCGRFDLYSEVDEPVAKRLNFGAAALPDVDTNLLMEAELLRIKNGGAIQAHWMPEDDEVAEVGDATTKSELALLDSLPQPEKSDTVSYKQELELLKVQAEAPGADFAALSLRMQLLKELRGTTKVEGGASKDLPSSLPANLLASYDFKGAKVSITEHIELLEDFLIDQPNRKKVRFLMNSLTGKTLKRFRKFYKSELNDQKTVSYERAKNWLLLKCTHKQERTVLFGSLQTVSMKGSETVEDLIERVTDMRRQLESMGVSETNFHVRQYVERAIAKGASNVYEKIQCEVGWESWQYSDFCTRAIQFDKALNRRTAALSFMSDSGDTDAAANAFVAKTGKGKKKKVPAGLENFTPEQRKIIHSYTDKQKSAVLAAAGVKYMPKTKGFQPRHKGKKFNQKSKTGKLEVTNLPGHAQEEALEELYDPADWDKRQKLLKSNPDQRTLRKNWFLFKNDLFEGKYVCYNCRKTGHTRDRCTDT